jgi:hypothetical protein
MTHAAKNAQTTVCTTLIVFSGSTGAFYTLPLRRHLPQTHGARHWRGCHVAPIQIAKRCQMGRRTEWRNGLPGTFLNAGDSPNVTK